MGITVLGAMAIDGVSPHPRERAALAALVVHRGETMSADRLAEAIWPDAALPGTWPKQVQAAIGRLRKLLGADRITTTSDGYRLDVDPDEIDAHRFETLVQRARDNHLDGDPARAVDGYRRALDLWRGAPYADVSGWPDAAAEADRLAQIRTAADEGLLRARLDAGDAVGVIPEAERGVRAEPLRESRWGLLALACYRAGRQADALAVLKEARRRLADELGVDLGRDLSELEKAILRQDPALDGALPVVETRSDCPYPGLAAFDESHAGDFFGRENEVQAAGRRLDAPGLLVITGASGSGKSSLVRAGVIPAQRRRGRSIRVFEPTSAIVAELRQAVTDRVPIDLVVVDQYEEIIEAGGDTAADVASLLARQVAEERRAIITVRSDFIDACVADPSLGPLMASGVLVVPPLRDDDLRRAVEEPAAQAGLRLEPGLVELVLTEAAGAPGVLPHLSHALVETWARREGPVLTVAGYRDSGGIAGSIAQSADQLFSTLDGADQEVCRSTLLRLVALAPDGLPVRRRIAASSLRDDPEQSAVLTRLAQTRLVSVEGDSVVLAHESLTRAWPRFRGWLRDGAADLEILGQLEAAAEAWDVAGRSDDDLARGARLQTMLEWRERSNEGLTGVEEDFLDTSSARAEDERHALAAAAAAERSQNRRLRFAIGAVAALLVAAVVAGGIAVRSASSEAAVAEDARIDALASTSVALRDENRTLAALLAAEAYQRWPEDSRTRGTLLGLLGSPAGATQRMYWPDAEIRVGGVPIPGTETALIVRDQQHPEIRDLSTGALLRAFADDVPDGDGQRRPFVQISDDGSIAVVLVDGEAGSTMSVLDVAAGTLIGEPIVLDQWAQAYGLSPSGRYAAYVSDETGDLIVVDTADGRVRTAPAFVNADFLYGQNAAIGFLPDDTMLVGQYHGGLSIVDPVTLTVSDTVPVPENRANTKVDVLEDGRIFTAGHGGFLLLSPDRALLWEQRADEEGRPCGFMTASVADDLLYCGDSDGLIEERRLDSGEATGRSISTEVGASGELYLIGEDLIAMNAASPSVTRWHLGGLPGITEVVVPEQAIAQGLDPSGRYLLTEPQGWDFFAETAEFIVWDADTDQVALTFTAQLAYWAANGLLRTLEPDQTNRYIDVATGEEWAAPVHDGEKYPDDPFAWSIPSASHDGTVIYDMSCCDGAIDALDADTGEPLGISFDLGAIGAAATTTPDGRLMIATGYDDDAGTAKIAVFDAATGEMIAEAGGPDFYALTVTSDERIITGSEESLLIMDLDLETLGVVSAPSASVTALDLTDDDQTLLVTTYDRRAALYNLETGQMMGDPLKSTFWINDRIAALDDGGDWLVINSPDGVVRWDLDPELWLAQVCRIAGRNLTAPEWDTYLSHVGEYRETCSFPAE